MRSPLQRGLFFSMGLAIFVTIGISAFVAQFFSLSRVDANLPSIQEFFSTQFGRVWHETAERERLADEAARAFRVTVELRSPSGALLSQHGERACFGPQWTFSAQSPSTAGASPSPGPSEQLGRIVVCAGQHASAERRMLFIALGSAGFVLWFFAGMIAHKLSAPLLRLTDVTREIGEGKLSSRARLGRHHRGEVGALARSINEMAERIQRQIDGQRELLAGVSHEIRTPLSRLRVVTEILRDQEVDEKSLRNIEREIEDIDDLTGQLLANSRLEFESVDRRELDALAIARAALERTSLPTDLLQVEGTGHPFFGDPTLIERALINLLENAKHHGGGLAKLCVHFGSQKVSFTALDSGPGFVESDLFRAFEPFYRGKHSSKGASSLGLGLSLVKRIARAHGGSVHAQNRPTGGAKVWFEIPSSPPDAKPA